MSSSEESEEYVEFEEPAYTGADDDIDAIIPADDPEHSDEEDDNVDLSTLSTGTHQVEQITFGNEAKYSKYETVICGDDRQTTNIMSKYEMTDCVSIRATQISTGGKCFVDVDGLSCPILMAKRELMMRMCPLLIKRTVGYRTVDGEFEQVKEEWNPNLMQFAVSYPEAG